MSESIAGIEERAGLVALAEPIEIGAVSVQPAGGRKRQLDIESLFGTGKRQKQRYALAIGSWRAVVVRETGLRGTSMRLEQPKQDDENQPSWTRHHRQRKLMRAAARRLGLR